MGRIKRGFLLGGDGASCDEASEYESEGDADGESAEELPSINPSECVVSLGRTREENGKKHEHSDSADVDEDLGQSDEFSAKGEEEDAEGEEGKRKEESSADEVARDGEGSDGKEQEGTWQQRHPLTYLLPKFGGGFGGGRHFFLKGQIALEDRMTGWTSYHSENR